jgi:hypothetical protein
LKSNVSSTSNATELQHEESLEEIDNTLSGLSFHNGEDNVTGEEGDTAETFDRTGLSFHNVEDNVTGEEEVGGDTAETFDRKDLKGRKVPELKKLLKSRGMSSKGLKKKEMIDRLLGEEVKGVVGGEAVDTAETFDRKDLMKKKVPELRELLKSEGMSSNGLKKKGMIDRLLGEEVHNDEDLSTNTINRLKEKLKALNKPTRGKREELINRLNGTEQFEEGSFGDYDRYTGHELIEKLKSQNKDTGGVREDLINRLLGKEPPMPDEAWQDSDDKVLLISKLKDGDVSSFRYQTAEQVHQNEPFSRWPFYRFKEYFRSALVSVLRDEEIVKQDNADFASFAAANPVSERDKNGKSCKFVLCSFNLHLLGIF